MPLYSQSGFSLLSSINTNDSALSWVSSTLPKTKLLMVEIAGLMGGGATKVAQLAFSSDGITYTSDMAISAAISTLASLNMQLLLPSTSGIVLIGPNPLKFVSPNTASLESTARSIQYYMDPYISNVKLSLTLGGGTAGLFNIYGMS